MVNQAIKYGFTPIYISPTTNPYYTSISSSGSFVSFRLPETKSFKKFKRKLLRIGLNINAPDDIGVVYGVVLYIVSTKENDETIGVSSETIELHDKMGTLDIFINQLKDYLSTEQVMARRI